MIIDSYTHCGVDKFLPLEAVLDCMHQAGVSKAVLAQHLGQTDNSYIEACVASDPSRLAGVAMIESAAPDAGQHLDALVRGNRFRGVRMTVDMMLANPEFARRAIDLDLNVVVYAPDGVKDAVDTITGLSRSTGAGKVVITHLGCPTFDGEIPDEDPFLLACAAAPNVMVTLSGLGMFTPYPHAGASAFVSTVVSAFGADRVMWGSNFPVVGDAAAYTRDLGLLMDNAWSLTREEIDAIAGGTAERAWFS